MTLSLAGARVLTMDPERRVLDADVVIADGRIAALRERTRTGKGSEGRGRSADVLDCTGLVILPGLIQAHIHLCQTLFRGLADDLPLEDWLARRIWPLEAAHSEESVYWSAMLGAAELLLGGTTAILDMETVRHTDGAFRALEEIGVRATAGKCLMDASSAPAELRESTDRALQEAADLCARWHGAAGGRLRYCFAPRFAPSCTGPLLRAVSDLAERHGAMIHTHAAETPVELELVKRETGHDEITYLDSVGISGPRAALAHCVWVDREGIGRLARQGTNVVHCPSSNLKLGSGIAPVPEMLSAGCRVALGADGAPCNNRLDAFEEMRLAALIQKPRLGPEALPAAQVIELATLGGARALGLEAELGSIEPGKRADLVALDLSGPHGQPEEADLVSRIVYAARAADVRHVVVDGRIVVRDGRLDTADVEEIRREANRHAGLLRRAAGLVCGAFLLVAAGCAGPRAAPPAPAPVPVTPPEVEAAPAEPPPLPPPPPAPPEPGVVWVAAVGDIQLGPEVPADPEAGPLATATRWLSAADLTLGNLEGPLTTQPPSKCRPGSTACYAFTTPPHAAEHLARVGLQLLSLANNHALDAGEAGRAETIEALTRSGLLPAVGFAPATAWVPTRPPGAPARRVALLGFATYSHSPDLRDPRQVEVLVRAAAETHDLVIVFFHGGAEGPDAIRVPHGPERYVGENRGDLRRFARQAIDAGANLVIGAGPHVLRGLEIYRGRLVAYSLGNFSGGGRLSTRGVRAHTGVLLACLDALSGRFLGGRWAPFRLDAAGVPWPDPDAGAIPLLRDLSVLDFPDGAVRVLDDGTLWPPEGAPTDASRCGPPPGSL